MKIRVYFDIFNCKGRLECYDCEVDYDMTREQHDNFDYLADIEQNHIDAGDSAQITGYEDEEGNTWS